MRRHAGLIPLSHDHQHALALCVVTERGLSANADAEAVRRAAAEILRVFDGEILDHFQFEERVLFPMLEPLEPLTELVAELRREHARILGLVDALRSHALKADVLEFCSLLRDHVRKEEGTLFERAQELLPAEQLDAIGAQRTRSDRDE